MLSCNSNCSCTTIDYNFFILQEELKIANLVYSIQTEEEIICRENQLNLKLEKARIVKVIFICML